jgi:hypothetical protein
MCACVQSIFSRTQNGRIEKSRYRESATRTATYVASVLVIAADPNIESLVGELVAFAGHRPMYDVTAGAAGESVRRIRPDVTMLDTSLSRSVVQACLSAADEVGSQPVLMSSTASTSELVAEARANSCLYFALPGGPRPLADIVDRAVHERAAPTVTALPERPRTERAPGSIHPALCAALASIARGRSLASHEDAIHPENARFRSETVGAADMTRTSLAALRAAVTDYARQLRAADLGIDDVLSIIHDAIADCATAVGAEVAMPALLLESEEWTRKAFSAA